MTTLLTQHASRARAENPERVNRFWASTVLIVLTTAAAMAVVAVENEFGGPPTPAAVIERRVATSRVALAEDPGDMAARLAIAEAYARAGFNARAAGEFKIALEVQPRNITALKGLARLYEENGSRVRAKKYYQLAADNAPEDVEAWSGLGRLAAEAEDFSAATDYWGRVVSLEPSLADARFQLGWALERTGRLGEAALEYEETLRYVPDFQAAEGGLARVGRSGAGIDE